MPLVSVLMPVFNSELYLAEAIESILWQTFADFELIIVDDGSEDNSAEIIRSYAARDDRIRFVQLLVNRGEGGARSACLAAAKGEFVTGMDSDDISLPDRLRKQVSFLQSNPQIDAVGVYSHVVTEDLRQQYDREPPERHAEIVLNCFIGLLSGPFVHASLMTRRRLLLEVGGYDESMRYSADSDLVTRLLGRTIFANIAEHLYVYRRYPGQLTSHDNPISDKSSLLARKRRLERIWGEAPMDALERLALVRAGSKLSWRERRAAKRDIKRLIDSLIAARWVDASERPLLIAVMNRRLEQVSPRLWQIFCHWRRHHFGAKMSEAQPR